MYLENARKSDTGVDLLVSFLLVPTCFYWRILSWGFTVTRIFLEEVWKTGLYSIRVRLCVWNGSGS